MNYRQPYDSPRVIRAIIEDLIEDISKEVFMRPAEEAARHAYFIIQMALSNVDYRGTKLSKLIAVDPVIEGHGLLFHFRKLSEDGEWLLKQLDLEHANSPEMKVPEAYVEKTISVKRVVDL